MDSTSDTNTSAKQPAETPFPSADTPKTATAAEQPQQGDGKASGVASPEADNLLKRVTQQVHDAVDSVSDRIASTIDGLQGGVANVGETRDEWMESVREAIRQHPFAAVGTAVLIGLALRSLSSSRER